VSAIEHRFRALALAAAALWSLLPAAQAAMQEAREEAGSVSGEVITGSWGSKKYALRGTLHTVLPSTPATIGALPPPYALYNPLHRPTWGGTYSGVADLFLNTSEGGFGCTGALLSTGRHVLTAAHCVTDGAGTPTLIDGEAFFPTTPTGTYTGIGETVTFKSVSVHPGWTGNFLGGGNDLAVITLDSTAPAGAQRYELYTGSSELTQIYTKVGWGQVGLGNGTPIFAGGFRMGNNTYDATGELVEPAFGLAANPGLLYYDFDDGLYSQALGYAPHDAFGYWFGINHLGQGLAEVSAAPGDSGGPTFIDGKIAGIASFGLTIWDDALGALSILTSDSTDPTLGPDSSFGEFGGDTRVSYYADWITAQTIPEPGSWALMLGGLLAVASLARRRR
jgi:hypothetical protein